LAGRCGAAAADTAASTAQAARTAMRFIAKAKDKDVDWSPIDENRYGGRN
jgi:hypothetical protein